jgi:hypothetical protein
MKSEKVGHLKYKFYQPTEADKKACRYQSKCNSNETGIFSISSGDFFIPIPDSIIGSTG